MTFMNRLCESSQMRRRASLVFVVVSAGHGHARTARAEREARIGGHCIGVRLHLAHHYAAG